jgi:TRAP-type C4-dicarboxylate transport system permease small subunit
MAFLTCSEIILRFLRKPIPGSYDIVGFLLAITIAFAMARTTLQRKHVAVQLLTMILSRRIQKIIFVLTQSVCFFFFFGLSIECAKYGDFFRKAGVVSPTLELPFFPIVYGMALSFAVVSLVLAVDILLVVVKDEDAWHTWKEE